MAIGTAIGNPMCWHWHPDVIGNPNALATQDMAIGISTPTASRTHRVAIGIRVGNPTASSTQRVGISNPSHGHRH